MYPEDKESKAYNVISNIINSELSDTGKIYEHRH